MGLLDRLFGRPEQPEHTIKATVSIATSDLVRIAGTTTFARDGAFEIAERHTQDRDGYAELSGVVAGAESGGAPTASVEVEGVRIGALPGFKAKELALPAGASRPVRVQMFYSKTPGGMRVDAWAWLGSGRPQWEYTSTKRPPVTTGERAKEAHEGHRKLVADGLAAGGFRAEEFRQGMYKGVHHLELIEPIKQLKRDGHLEEALELCYQAIKGAERGRQGREPAPWYTIQAAIIHRKLKQRDEEIAVLERWLRVCPADRRAGSQVEERLAKLQ